MFAARTMVAVAVLLVCACGGDGPGVGLGGALVGGSCGTAANCAPDSTCLTGGDFPGGTCALPCSVQEHCPAGTACVDEKDGFCLLTCELTRDCRPGYACKGKKRAEKTGEVLVCVK